MDSSNISYLLFDHDGVLVETEYWYFKATQRGLAHLGIDLPLEGYRQHLVDGASNWDVARQQGIAEKDISSARVNRDRYYQEYLINEDINIEGVGEVLTTLSRRFQMAIVTTSKRQDFELIHASRNIVPHFDFVLCNGEYPRAKPAPDPYLTAIARFGCDRSQALVIEDSERGLRSAVAAGIGCITIHNDFTAHQDLSAADQRLPDLRALAEVLDRGEEAHRTPVK